MKVIVNRVFFWILAIVFCVALLFVVRSASSFGEPRATADISGVRYSSEIGAVTENPTDDVTVIDNVSYGKDENCKFNVAFIDNGMKKPVIVFVHGDTYFSGSRNDLNTLLNTYASKGYVTVSVDYGILTDTTITQQQRYLSDALDFLSMNAEKYQVDTRRIAVFGVSSGAQVATRVVEMISNDPDQYSFHIVGLVVLNGITDFATYFQVGKDEQLLSIREKLEWIDKGEEEEEETAEAETDEEGETRVAETRVAQTKEEKLDLVTEFAKIDPKINVTSQMPPVLVMHGSDDTVIPLSVGRSFYNGLQSARVTSSMVILNGMGHEVEFGRIIPPFDEFLLKYV